jgi:hypothetical protein
VLITPSLGVPNWPVIYIINTAPPTIFLAPAKRQQNAKQCAWPLVLLRLSFGLRDASEK